MAYTKKTWKDYPDTSTPITAEDLQNIEDGIEALDTGKVDKTDIGNIITAVAPAYSLTADNTYELPPYVATANVGSKLSVVSNQVKIGAGVSYVKISGSAYVISVADTRIRYLTLYKNNSSIMNRAETITSGERQNIDWTPYLISVAENDVLDFRVYGKTGDNWSRVYFTVEVVG